MSHHSYKVSQQIAGKDYPFYSLIMAAMRQADTYNLEALQMAFPGTWWELQERYNAPGGFLPDELSDEAVMATQGHDYRCTGEPGGCYEDCPEPLLATNVEEAPY